MPAIYLYGRRSWIGGDDLMPFVILAMLVRFTQVLFLIPLFVHLANVEEEHDNNNKDNKNGLLESSSSFCEHEQLFIVFLYLYSLSSLIYTLASAIWEYKIGYWSKIGFPTIQTEPRSSMIQKLLEWKLFPFSIVSCFLVGIGLVLKYYSSRYEQCQRQRQVKGLPPSSSLTIRNMSLVAGIFLLSTQFVDLGITWLYFMNLLSKPRHVSQQQQQQRVIMEDDDEEQQQQQRAKDEETWIRCCSCCFKCLGISCCFLCGGQEIIVHKNNHHHPKRKVNFDGLATALTNFFNIRGGNLDIVPSDITAGFRIMQKLQKVRRNQSRIEIAHAIVSSQQQGGGGREEEEIHSTSSRTTIHVTAAPEEEEKEDDKTVGVVVLVDQDTRCDTSKNPCTLRVEDGGVESTREDGQDKSILYADKEEAEPITSVTEDEIFFDAMSEIPMNEEDVIKCESPFPGDMGDQPQSMQCSDDHCPIHDTTNSPHLPVVLSRNIAADIAQLEEGAHYVKFALAMYTWVMYLLIHPFSGIPRLIFQGFSTSLEKLCNSYHGSKQGEGNEPNRGCGLCDCHKSAILLTLGLDNSDIVYVQMKSGFNDTPYSIVLDHDWKNVVLSIRGTFSLEDAVKDSLIEAESLSRLGRDFGFDGVNQFCHCGMLLAAKNILTDLQRHDLLNKLLVNENAKYPDYKLRVVGHSLGAGAGIMLSYLLRQTFPSLRCVCFSPPGCTLSWGLAVGCKEWCNSFVLDCDIVPRLSIESLESWRNELLAIIGRIKVPKSEIFKRLSNFSESRRGGCIGGVPVDDDNDDTFVDDMADILFKEDEVPDSKYKRQFETYTRMQQEQRYARQLERGNDELFPPGNIIHFVKKHSVRKRRIGGGFINRCLIRSNKKIDGNSFTPVHISNNSLNTILVSPKMLNHHFIDRVQIVLEAVAKSYCAPNPR